ncbi:hypothetical protein BB560_002237 [Smittium megazygosporum]|uniref:Uncharacterized protein n=1 Tax=Smittium megazygosporum TaxID=133381 RepID=A0A2T9ZFB8_9FUNG|nr:hypothetical protein BB560_002237 [Smittium megazygosporum]
MNLYSKVIAIFVALVGILLVREKVFRSNYDENIEYMGDGRTCLNDLMHGLDESLVKSQSISRYCYCMYKITSVGIPDFEYYNNQMYHTKGDYLGSAFFKKRISDPREGENSEMLIQIRCMKIFDNLKFLKFLV